MRVVAIHNEGREQERLKKLPGPLALTPIESQGYAKYVAAGNAEKLMPTSIRDFSESHAQWQVSKCSEYLTVYGDPLIHHHETMWDTDA